MHKHSDACTMIFEHSDACTKILEQHSDACIMIFEHFKICAKLAGQGAYQLPCCLEAAVRAARTAPRVRPAVSAPMLPAVLEVRTFSRALDPLQTLNRLPRTSLTLVALAPR
jgi:hypothetical protein